MLGRRIDLLRLIDRRLRVGGVVTRLYRAFGCSSYRNNDDLIFTVLGKPTPSGHVRTGVLCGAKKFTFPVALAVAVALR